MRSLSGAARRTNRDPAEDLGSPAPAYGASASTVPVGRRQDSAFLPGGARCGERQNGKHTPADRTNIPHPAADGVRPFDESGESQVIAAVFGAPQADDYSS